MPTRPIAVTTSPQVVLSYNNRRTAASITNLGAATVFVSEDETSITTNGYPIVAGGAFDWLRALGDEPHNRWFIESSAGGEDVRILEAFGSLPVMFQPGNVEQRGQVIAP